MLTPENMGNELKRCFTASEDSQVAGGTKPAESKQKKEEEVPQAKKNNQQQQEAPSKKEQQQQVEVTDVIITKDDKKKDAVQPVKPKPLLRPSTHFNHSSLSSPPQNPKNKYSYETDAKFFQKNVKSRKPLNRNLEHYEARDISGEKNGNDKFDVHFLRGPDDIQDQRVTVENCKENARIVIADESDSVQIDECQNCSFYIGPSCSSVFIRNCKNCTFVAVCSQLRLRDCKQCFISLLTATKPVIESSSEIAFSCWRGPEYSDLKRQLAKAKLSVLNNRWWQIHDFTPNPSTKPNYVIFGDDADQEKLKQEFISALCCPPLIDSLAFKNSKENNLEAVESSQEEEEMFRSEPQTVPRVFSRARTVNGSSPTFIMFQPGAYETAIKFCLRLSKNFNSSDAVVDISQRSRIRYAVEMKFQNDKIIKDSLEGYLTEKLMKESDFEAKGKKLQQELSGNVACCVVVEEIEGDEIGFTEDEVKNILIFVEKDTKLVKMLTHTVFLSAQATGGSGFGQAF